MLTNKSGDFIGAHQKFNRVAHRHLRELLELRNISFPSLKQILRFEGKNGPDGIKAKSPGHDEPYHFYDPFDPTYTELLEYLNDHYSKLVASLKKQDTEKASYEAAWLAHVLTDGLTPAHHFPYEEELEKLRGEDNSTRNSIAAKNIIKGENTFQTVKKNWHFWGPKGLFTTHWWFEWGVTAIIKPLKMHNAMPTEYDIKTVKHLGIEEFFKRTAREIALLDMYDRFYKRGWTPSLAKDVRRVMAPLISRTITLAWHSAALEAQQT
ncbi:hypothetical protein KC878_01220 [Candidatus Saccharibacteria bacterium]|nr:hypothetical protein [Candidatus Saccharibacteria bacterium]MCB9821594.1 hypothetical protein [Candidatus Nomurabacteria bacterium]